MLTYGWKTGSLYCAMPEAGATNTLSYYQRNMVGPDEDSSSTSKLFANLTRAIDKREYLVTIRDNFFLFCIKTYVVTPHLNHLDEMVQMRGHNILFR